MRKPRLNKKEKEEATKRKWSYISESQKTEVKLKRLIFQLDSIYKTYMEIENINGIPSLIESGYPLKDLEKAQFQFNEALKNIDQEIIELEIFLENYKSVAYKECELKKVVS